MPACDPVRSGRRRREFARKRRHGAAVAGGGTRPRGFTMFRAFLAAPSRASVRAPSWVSISTGVAARAGLRCRLAATSAGNRNRPYRYICLRSDETGWHETDGAPSYGSCGPMGGPAHAQTDFVTLEENVDASGTALMCPTRTNDYVDCADAGTLPVPSVRGRTAALGQPRVAHGSCRARPPRSPRSSPARMARPLISAGSRRAAAWRRQGRSRQSRACMATFPL